MEQVLSEEVLLEGEDAFMGMRGAQSVPAEQEKVGYFVFGYRAPASKSTQRRSFRTRTARVKTRTRVSRFCIGKEEATTLNGSLVALLRRHVVMGKCGSAAVLQNMPIGQYVAYRRSLSRCPAE